MIPEPYQRIINKLYKGTLSGKLTWKRTPLDDRILISFSNYAITMEIEGGAYLNNTILFKIIDNAGNEIDSFQMQPRDTDYRNMFDMFESGRRSASNVREAIKDIEDELDNSVK